MTEGKSPLGTNVWNVTDDENSEHPWIYLVMGGQSVEVGQLPVQVNVVLSNMIFIEMDSVRHSFKSCKLLLCFKTQISIKRRQ